MPITLINSYKRGPPEMEESLGNCDEAKGIKPKGTFHKSLLVGSKDLCWTVQPSWSHLW